MTDAIAPKQTAAPTRTPGEPGVWLFVFGDMMIFAIMFGIFLHYRWLEPEIFLQSQATLNMSYGAINVLLLLTSSWFVASAISHLKQNAARDGHRLLIGALVCGLGFVLIKLLEYGEKIGAGITVDTNSFYLYYYFLTGIHFLHVIIGLFVLGYLISKAHDFDNTRNDIGHYESGGIYWHMVDFLWIILFPLIYLVQ